MSRVLESQVVVAETIEAAVATAGELRPHVILLDAMLPDGIGWEAIPRFRRVSPHSEIVVATALGRLTDGVRAVGEHGAFAYLDKSEGTETIRREMRRAFMASMVGAVRRWRRSPRVDLLHPLPRRHLA
jgi:DNA-binding response OmpR family regulator